MKLRIVSDGTPGGTRVENENGEEVAGVASVAWSLDVKDRSTAVFVVRSIEIDAEGEALLLPAQPRSNMGGP